MLTKLALEFLNDVVEECEKRSCSVDEPEQKRELFALAADEISTLMETVVEEPKRKAS